MLLFVMAMALLLGWGGISFVQERKRKAAENAWKFQAPEIYGDKGWATDKDCKSLFGRKGIRLGFSAESGKEFRFRQDTHLVLVGPTGASKTSSFLLPNIIDQNGTSKFLVDIKGAELTQIAGKYLAKQGKFYVLAPYGLDHVPPGVKIARYNPMAPLFDGSMPPIFHEAIARRNADGCVGGEAIGKDSFFTNGARRVFTVCQLALAKHGKPEERNLPAVARWIESDFRGLCVRMILANDPEWSPVFETYLKETKKDKAGFSDIIQTIVVETQFLRDPAIAATLSGSDFRFSQMGSEVMTVALCTPLDLVEVNGKLSRLVVSNVLGELLRPERPRKVPIILFCDEAYQYGTMEALVNAYATARSFNVRVWSVWQDLSQMEERYPKTHMSILANSGAQIFFGSREPRTSKFMAEQSGFRDIGTRSRSINWGRDGWPVVSDSMGQTRREVLLMNEAQNLNADEALLWIRGIKGIIRAKHKRYFDQWRYFFRYQKNPLYRR